MFLSVYYDTCNPIHVTICCGWPFITR